MAIYEFSCQCCKHTFEMLILRDNESGLVACPACGRKDLSKKISKFSAKPKGEETDIKPQGGCKRSHAC